MVGKRTMAAVGLTCLAAMNAIAAEWRQIGPPGGVVTTLVPDPCRAVRAWAVVDSAGILRSDDGGRSWLPRNVDLSSLDITSLALDPGRCDSVMVGVDGRGAFRSLDAGESWTPASDGLEVSGNIVSAPYRTTFVPGSPGRAVAFTSSGLSEWDDATERWTTLGRYDREELLVGVPSQPGVVLMSQRTSIWRSSDGGRSFEKTLEPPKSVFSAIGSFAGGGTWAATYSGLVFSSDDGGAHWTSVAGTGGDILGLQYDAGDHTLYAATRWGLYGKRSGASWALVNEQAGLTPYSTGLGLYALVDGAHLIGRWPEGVARCPGADQPCEPGNRGIQVPPMRAVAVEPGGGRVFALDQISGNWTRLQRFDDDTGEWSILAAPPGSLDQLAFGPGPDPVLYAFGFAYTTPQTVYSSRDQGLTWNAGGPPFSGGYPSVTSVAFVPGRHDAVVAATPRGVWRSDDIGRSWDVLVDGEFTAVAVDPRDPQSLWAGGPVIRRSRDGGATWADADGGHPESFPGSGTGAWVQSLGVAPWDSEVALAVLGARCDWGQQCLFVTRDGGANWAAVWSPPFYAYDVTLLPADATSPGRIVLFGRDADFTYWAVWESRDLGVTWSVVGDAFSAQPFDLAVASAGQASRRWALATSAGVWIRDETVYPGRQPRRRLRQ